MILGRRELVRGYVLFGSQDPFPATLATSALDGSNGFAIEGTGYSFAVDGAGDVNGDSIDDIVIGGSDGTSGAALGKELCSVRIVKRISKLSGFSALNGANGFVMNGRDAVINPRISVSGAGDVNHDGVGDILIGDPYITQPGGFREGESYIVFGSTSGFPATLTFPGWTAKTGLPCGERRLPIGVVR